ncbi:exonuclease SbcC [Paenibacillus algorifonticola]|uniref:Nuclease SbcCD subunit C n=1 Tax=Paenibacillus algorifonticola TaxID=684063 RepID=A0A1I2H0Q6_9BACL|nr:SMC family ATPase [Paenibacillus algorifonticola]SFF22577.1 exonuclease SbcC [Paenibacillus algorifonticola]
MIPLRIVLNNFRAVSHADIDLSAVSLAAIAGKNGAGKSSAFTLAPRFALFGDVVKGVSLDDLVRRGEQEMSVEFWFEHQGCIFRAIRTRSTKGKGKSTLELQQRVNSAWESRSAEKIVDTEAVIRELLNLDDETFTSSSMILQGQANAFTGATAGKRKEILSQILGLNVYEQLQERARQKSADLNIEIEKSKDKLLTLDERLSVKPSKAIELEVAEDQLSITLAMIEQDEVAIKSSEAALTSLKAKTERIGHINREIGSEDDDISILHAEQSEHVGRLDRAEKILANADTIQSKSAALVILNQQIVTLEAQQPELNRLQQSLTLISSDLSKLDVSVSSLSGRMDVLQLELAGRETLRQQANEYELELVRLQAFEEQAEQHNLLAAELRIADTEHERQRAYIELQERVLGDKIGVLEQKEALMHDSGCLPTCKFQHEASVAVAELPELRRQLTELDRSELDRQAAVIADKRQQQDALQYHNMSHKACRQRVDQLNKANTAYAQLASKEELLEQLSSQYEEAAARRVAEQEKLQQVTEQVEQLSTALAPLPQLKLDAEGLERWARLKDQIAAAQEARLAATERIAAISLSIAAKQVRKSDLQIEHDALVLDTLDHDRIDAELTVLRVAIQRVKQQQSSLTEHIGGIKAVLASLEADQQERDRIYAELEPLSVRWTRYQTLIKAYGRDGIPALIIENAVPQLERIANEILGQMSKGKHYVRFETQRELKSRAGLSETLDIMVGDWSAERPYETFSGGEQLRIDYAIRFALAELLAQRAGSKVEWLTIDEGLGSQDAEHRALVLDSIKAVAGRFKRVLVITHIEDAQAAFDQVIRFDNSDGGVAVQIA